MILARIAIIALLVITLVSTVACGSSSNHTPGFATYTDYTNGFSISAPDGWDIEPMKESGDWAFFSPNLPCGGHFAVSSVMSLDLGSTSLETYYYIVAKSLYEDDLDEYHFISEESLTIDSVHAIKVIFTYVDDGTTLQRMDCYLAREKTLWWIAEDCASTCWNTYEGTFNTMISSFRVLD
jgi:hypothetical protein